MDWPIWPAVKASGVPALRNATNTKERKRMKTCTKCFKPKTLGEFYPRKDRASGLTSHCKSCISDRHKKNRLRNRDSINAASRESWHKNKTAHRDRRLRRMYGITLAEYNALTDMCGNQCQSCDKPVSGKGRDKLYVDHNHHTGAIRGLICNSCNRAIGLLGDTSRDVQLAADYLVRSES